MDSDDPPETVLWQDNLHTDTSANWTQFFATTNGAPDDYTVTWAYDYYNIQVIPGAPHSGGDTHGLYMSVNNDGVPAAAALNLYPNGQSFSGNYALRFDMCLLEGNGLYTTEYALFGVNHSGTKTNWFRGSTVGYTGVNPTAWDFDGIFYVAEADASGTDDYLGYSSPTGADHNPTPIAPGVGATALKSVFRSPPWAFGGVGGGSPSSLYGTGTNIWADVEIAQINGVIYWSINHTLIFAYTNSTPYTSGNIMLGYLDAYDSITPSGAAVIYANARVVSLANPTITSIVQNGGNVEITFSANASDTTSQFTLQQSTPSVAGAYSDTSSTITSLGGGLFKSVKAMGAGQTFYRIRRIY
jgi:hypothetical protein